MGPILGDHPPRGVQHRRDRGLVVRAEDRAAGVADDAVVDDGLNRSLRRNRVQVGAEEERRSLSRSVDPAEEVARVRVDP